MAELDPEKLNTENKEVENKEETTAEESKESQPVEAKVEETKKDENGVETLETEEGVYTKKEADVQKNFVYKNASGKVDGIYNAGSSDIYVIKDELGKQILLPAIKDVLKEVDLENQKIIVHLIKGLVD